MIVIGIDVILNNAFYSKPSQYLTMKDLRKFCDILEEEIINNTSYKYIHLAVSKNDIDDYLDSNTKFVRGINKIHCISSISEDDVYTINKRYIDKIHESILNASKIFASS